MSKLSISFTLGKASVAHGANVEHNNREFIAGNIDPKRISQNVTYVRQDVREAYQELFGKAVADYNAKQKQPCRRISDYYKHISESKREEAFYEIVVQFGDSKTAPCGSPTGEAAQKMLDDYVRSFKERNPNLYIFNAVMHMDEASPHLHINFIPFYTRDRQKGLQVGVSMKAALDEQGFTAKNFRENRLVAWEESERGVMEQILQRHGFSRDDKGADYAHMDVDTFKQSQDEKKIMDALRKTQHVSGEDMTAENIRRLKSKLQQAEQEKNLLEQQKQSPYKAFYYSVPDKQAFVQTKLDELGIPYRETENGFEAQECYVEMIRKLEKEFKAPRSAARDKLRSDIDRLLMQSGSLEELLDKLKKEKYTIKQSKYLAVKPSGSGQFIRLKSLGEQYSEYALKNRLNAKKKYEQALEKKIQSTVQKKSRDAFEVIVLRTMQFYTISFSKGALPVRKREQQKPFSWTNDAELDKLTALNQKINSGATPESLRRDFEIAESTVSEKEKLLEKSKSDLKTFYELKEKLEILFEGKPSDVFTKSQAEQTLQQYSAINRNNYHNVEILINNETETMKTAEAELDAAQKQLKDASDILATAENVMGGTYVQSLVGEERERREADYLPNGIKPAG